MGRSVELTTLTTAPMVGRLGWEGTTCWSRCGGGSGGRVRPMTHGLSKGGRMKHRLAKVIQRSFETPQAKISKKESRVGSKERL